MSRKAEYDYKKDAPKDTLKVDYWKEAGRTPKDRGKIVYYVGSEGDDTVVYLHKGYIPKIEADIAFRYYLRQDYYNQKMIMTTWTPRLMVHMSDKAVGTHRYSGIVNETVPWDETTGILRRIAESGADEKFNSAIVQVYRGRDDSIGMHGDGESKGMKNYCVAILSFGQHREFRLEKNDKSVKHKFMFCHGDLLVMKGIAAQEEWKHGIDKISKAKKYEDVVYYPRVSVSFRNLPEDAAKYKDIKKTMGEDVESSDSSDSESDSEGRTSEHDVEYWRKFFPKCPKGKKVHPGAAMPPSPPCM